MVNTIKIPVEVSMSVADRYKSISKLARIVRNRVVRVSDMPMGHMEKTRLVYDTLGYIKDVVMEESVNYSDESDIDQGLVVDSIMAMSGNIISGKSKEISVDIDEDRRSGWPSFNFVLSDEDGSKVMTDIMVDGSIEVPWFGRVNVSQVPDIRDIVDMKASSMRFSRYIDRSTGGSSYFITVKMSRVVEVAESDILMIAPSRHGYLMGSNSVVMGVTRDIRIGVSDHNRIMDYLTYAGSDEIVYIKDKVKVLKDKVDAAVVYFVSKILYPAICQYKKYYINIPSDSDRRDGHISIHGKVLNCLMRVLEEQGKVVQLYDVPYSHAYTTVAITDHMSECGIFNKDISDIDTFREERLTDMETIIR